MRRMAATYLFPINHPPLKNGIVVCEDNGTVEQIIDTGGQIPEEAGLEYYSGILVPGFVNAHCHLELSNLRGKIPGKNGLGNFIGHINRLRNRSTENLVSEMKKADRRMWAAGIVAAGDISNSSLSLEIKKKSKIFYHTFIEAFGFKPTRAQRAFDWALIYEKEFHHRGLKASVVPHSAYSVSEPLFKMIGEKAKSENSILSIHNQESEAESEFFQNGTGPIAEHLQKNLGINISSWNPKNKCSLELLLKLLPEENRLLLVHNTFSRLKDIDELKRRRSTDNTHLVLCPNSNLFIENQISPVDLFHKQGLNICIGTDSLASNRRLSILDEIFTIQQYCPEIDLEELIRWASLNGAKALEISDRFGSFEKGKTPGVNLISGVDFRNMKLTEKSKVKRLI